MITKQYSVEAIDAMRSLCRNKILFGAYVPKSNMISKAYVENELFFQIEEMVRTHMMAGNTPDDLRESKICS